MSPAVSLPKARPIVLSAVTIPLVLAGTKTQTRRLVSPFDELSPGSGLARPVHSPHHGCDGIWRWKRGSPVGAYYASDERRCPYGAVGDLLWVKETWAVVPKPPPGGTAICRVGPDGKGATYREAWTDPKAYVWKSPRFMPRWASRLTLQITNVRAQRLHEITDADAIAEGVKRKVIPTFFDRPGTLGEIYEIEGHEFAEARTAFSFLWDGINGKRSPWEANAWVWSLTFKRVEGT